MSHQYHAHHHRKLAWNCCSAPLITLCSCAYHMRVPPAHTDDHHSHCDGFPSSAQTNMICAILITAGGTHLTRKYGNIQTSAGYYKLRSSNNMDSANSMASSNNEDSSNSTNSPNNEWYQSWLYRHVELPFERLLRPGLKSPGYARLEWTCSCGRVMYGDYTAASCGALLRSQLAQRLFQIAE